MKHSVFSVFFFFLEHLLTDAHSKYKLYLDNTFEDGETLFTFKPGGDYLARNHFSLRITD